MANYISNARKPIHQNLSVPSTDRTNAENSVFFRSGREALIALLESLDISGPKSVLLPGLLPEGLYAPFRAKGLHVEFYGLTDDLAPDLTSVAKCMAARPLSVAILVHFFGNKILPDVRDAFVNACRDKSIFCIEDQTHLFSGDVPPYILPEGVDATLVSFPKLLGVPDGAAITIGDSDLRSQISAKPFRKADNVYIFVCRLLLMLNYLSRRLTFNGASIFCMKVIGKLYDPYKKLMQSFETPRSISDRSLSVILSMNLKAVSQQRLLLRQAYINGLDPDIFVKLAGDDLEREVPFGFPVLVEERSSLINDLAMANLRGTTLVNKWDFTSDIEDQTVRRQVQDLLARHFIFPLQEYHSLEDIHQVIEAANNWASKQKAK